MSARGNGHAYFDHTIWYIVAYAACDAGLLPGWRGWSAAPGNEDPDEEWRYLIDAKHARMYARALSSLGWCLRDAGAIAAAELQGNRRGVYEGICAAEGEDPDHGLYWHSNTKGDPFPKFASLHKYKST